MRALLVSDLHYNLRKLDWVLDHADDLDLLVIAGDLLDLSSGLPLDSQIVVVLEYLARCAARTTTVVCSGNHDLDHRTDGDEKATRWILEARDAGAVVDGDTVEVDGWLVTACAWWEGPTTLDRLKANLAAGAARRGDRPWLWAFHGPPDGPLAWTGKRHFGDPELPGLLEEHQPDVVLCGHVHEAPFRDGGSWLEQRGSTWLFNAGQERTPVPTHVRLDLDGRTATWSSSMGSEERSLAGSPAQ